jgi:hypothetical protein
MEVHEGGSFPYGGVAFRRGEIMVGDVCVVIDDVFIDGSLAFRKHQKVVVEKLEPSAEKPEYTYVAYSVRLGSLFYLSDRELIRYRTFVLDTLGKLSPAVILIGAVIILLSSFSPVNGFRGEEEFARTVIEILVPLIFAVLIGSRALVALGAFKKRQRDRVQGGLTIVLSVAAMGLCILLRLHGGASQRLSSGFFSTGVDMFLVGGSIAVIGAAMMMAGTQLPFRPLEAHESAHPAGLVPEVPSGRDSKFERELFGEMHYCPNCSAATGRVRTRCCDCGEQIREPTCLFSFASAVAAWTLLVLYIFGVAAFGPDFANSTLSAKIQPLLRVALFAVLALATAAMTLSVLGDRAVKKKPHLGGKELAHNGGVLATILFVFLVPVIAVIIASL